MQRSSIILQVENLSKQYRLGTIGTGTLGDDLKRWWYQVRGKEDPFLKVGAVNDRAAIANEDYVWALRDINFEVKQGEVLGVIGKNGAGKSTLLKILSKVTSPTTGSIKTRGRIASLLEVGTGFHGELTGRENIFMNGAVLGMTRREIKDKLDEIIAFSGCEKYIDTPVKRYSSGMTVRLAFAVAAHLEPEILVIDEVLAVGDAEFQKKAIGKMQDLSKDEGRTVLFVSHNMASIQHLCNRLVVLDNGFKTFDGNVKEGVDFYLTRNLINEISLEDRKIRIGGENFRFTDLQILDEVDNSKVDLLCGNKYLFKIRYTLKKKLFNTSIRILFLDSKGNIRFLCNNMFSSNLENLEPTLMGEIHCEIPEFPLPKGSYSIRLTCVSNEGFEDDIEGAFNFDVIGGDFFGTGREQILRDGVLVKNSFFFH